MHYEANGPVVVAGGTGVVGRHFLGLVDNALVLTRQPKSPSHLRFDLSADETLDVGASALVAMVNDPDDKLLLLAARAGVPFVDITRWTPRVTSSIARLQRETLRAPVVFSSAWMAGVAPRVAAALAASLPTVDRIEISIRYGVADMSGEDSIAYVDRFSIPFEVMDEGVRKTVYPLTSGRKVAIAGDMTRVYRFDTPEQLTLPLITGARTVATRLGFDDTASTLALATLQRLGVLCALSGERFTPLRRRLLRSKGTGAAAAFRVEVSGGGQTRSADVVDPLGQAHLTAVGAWLSLQQALVGAPGVFFPEQDLATRIDALSGHGVHLAA